MDYIKKHLLTVFFIFIWIAAIGVSYYIYDMFTESSGQRADGSRYDGVEFPPVTDEQIKQITDEIMKEDIVLKVNKPFFDRKILKVIVYVADEAEEKKSKELATKITDALTEEQLDFYDIHFYITKYYNCTLEATGKMDEEGNFTESVTVKFSSDLSKNEYLEDYGLINKNEKTYNKEQKFNIEEDGEYIIYGYTKDKLKESSCSIKITKKESNESTVKDTINSVTTRSFPIIGQKKAGIDGFSWTKSR